MSLSPYYSHPMFIIIHNTVIDLILTFNGGMNDEEVSHAGYFVGVRTAVCLSGVTYQSSPTIKHSTPASLQRENHTKVLDFSFLNAMKG